MNKYKKEKLYNNIIYPIITIILFSSVSYWVYLKNAENKQKLIDQYIIHMKDAWFRTPTVIKNLKKCELILSGISDNINKKRKNELLYEYSRTIEGTYSQTNEIIRRLENIFPPSELVPIHTDFKNFLYVLKSSEISLINFTRSENKNFLLESEKYLIKSKKLLKKLPSPDDDIYKFIFGKSRTIKNNDINNNNVKEYNIDDF